MRDIKNKKYNVIIATNIAREGLDIPHLDRLFLVIPKKGDSDSKTPDGTGVEQNGKRKMNLRGKISNKNNVPISTYHRESKIRQIE